MLSAHYKVLLLSLDTCVFTTSEYNIALNQYHKRDLIGGTARLVYNYIDGYITDIRTYCSLFDIW